MMENNAVAYLNVDVAVSGEYLARNNSGLNI